MSSTGSVHAVPAPLRAKTVHAVPAGHGIPDRHYERLASQIDTQEREGLMSHDEAAAARRQLRAMQRGESW